LDDQAHSNAGSYLSVNNMKQQNAGGAMPSTQGGTKNSNPLNLQ